MHTSSETETRDERLATFLIVLLCLGFLLMGLFGLYMFSLRPIWQFVNSRDWLETPCEVVSSQVDVHHDSDGDTYNVNVAYKYGTDGRQHVGRRFDFDSSRSSERAANDVIVAQHPVGFRGVCFVDPDDHESSVMYRSPGDGAVWGLLTVPFVLIGSGGLYLFISSKRPADSHEPAAFSLERQKRRQKRVRTLFVFITKR